MKLFVRLFVLTFLLHFPWIVERGDSAQDDLLCHGKFYKPTKHSVCCMCPAGTYLVRDCSTSMPNSTRCEDCLFNRTYQTFMPDFNNSTSCYRSKTCENIPHSKLILGNRRHDNECICMDGYWRPPKSSLLCSRHSKCPKGFDIISEGNWFKDTICARSSTTTKPFTIQREKEINFTLLLTLALLFLFITASSVLFFIGMFGPQTSRLELECKNNSQDLETRGSLEGYEYFDLDTSECQHLDPHVGHVHPRGCFLHFENLHMEFPRGAVEQDTIAEVIFDCSFQNAPSNVIPISQILVFSPTVTFQDSIHCRVITWCSAEFAGEEAILYYQENQASEWVPDQLVKLIPGKREVEFRITKFCRYFIGVKENTRATFHFETCLFANDVGKVVNHFIPQNSNKDVLGLCLGTSFKSVCGGGRCFHIKVGDKVTIALQKIGNGKSHFKDIDAKVKITTSFLRNPNFQSFLLEEKCTGSVTFSHQIKHVRNGEEIDGDYHKDRISVGIQARNKGQKTAKFINEGSGPFTVHEGNGVNVVRSSNRPTETVV